MSPVKVEVEVCAKFSLVDASISTVVSASMLMLPVKMPVKALTGNAPPPSPWAADAAVVAVAGCDDEVVV